MLTGENRFDVSQASSFTFALRSAGAKSIVVEFGFDGNGKCSGSVAVFLGQAVSGAPPWRTIAAQTMRVYPSPETDFVTIVPSAGALGICTVSLSQEQLGVGIYPFDPAGGGGGGGIAIAAGTPQGAGTVGALAAASDGVPGALLYAWVASGAFPIPVNFGTYALPSSSSSPAVPMLRATKAGSLMVAFLSQASIIEVTLGSGWTSIYANSGPTPALEACWKPAVGDATDSTPYAAIAGNQAGGITVLEIANANLAAPIAASSNSSGISEITAALNELVLLFTCGTAAQPFGPQRGMCGTPIVSSASGGYIAHQLTAFPFIPQIVPPNAALWAAIGATTTEPTGIVAIAPGAGTVNYWAPIG